MLEGRISLVTGAGRGIGRGIALALAEAGADVAVNYRRDADAAEEVVGRIRALGRRAIAVPASVADPEEVEALCTTVAAELGPVDLLVANAGIASRGRTILESPPEEFELLMATHTFGLVRIVQRLLPAMRESARADVVVISSSEVAHMRPNCAPYNAAKAALEAVAMTLAKEEIAHGVRVNVVAPGLVDTDMGRRLVEAALGKDEVAELDAEQPLGRVCRPADVGAVVRFLVSADGEMVTGQRIVVDGGVASPTVAHERIGA